MYLDHVVVCSNTKLFSQQLNRLRIVNDLLLHYHCICCLWILFSLFFLSSFFFRNSLRNLFISQTLLVSLKVWFRISFIITAEKCPNTEIFSGPYLPVFGPNTEIYGIYYETVFSPNTGKYGPEKTPYLDTFHAMCGD